jgi:hypothetical protein
MLTTLYERPLALLQQVLQRTTSHITQDCFKCFLSYVISRTISAEGFTGWVGAERQAGVPGCKWADMTTGLSQARLEHRNGSGGIGGLTLLSLHHYHS